MPALRGLLASLGASVSLVAAGSLALLAISVVIGVGGLLDGLGSDEEGTLSIPQQGVVPRSEPGPPEEDSSLILADAPEEDASAPPAEPVAAPVPPPVADGPAPVADRRGFNPPPDDGLDDRPEPPRPPTPPDDDSLAVSQPAGSGGVTGLTGEVLRTTGETLAPVTNTLLPGSGNLVEALTDDVANTVESTGNTLAATSDLLLNGR